MSWRNFKALIIADEPPVATKAYSNARVLIVIFGVIFGLMVLWYLTWKFALIMGFLLLMARMCQILGPLFVNRKVSTENVKGNMELAEDSISILGNTEATTPVKFLLDDITSVRIYISNGGDIYWSELFMTNRFNGRCDVLHGGTHYCYNFMADGIQQRENLTYIYHCWMQKGYKVSMG